MTEENTTCGSCKGFTENKCNQYLEATNKFANKCPLYQPKEEQKK